MDLPLDPLSRRAWRAGVRCVCWHLPSEHRTRSRMCGVGDCPCLVYSPMRSDVAGAPVNAWRRPSWRRREAHGARWGGGG